MITSNIKPFGSNIECTFKQRMMLELERYLCACELVPRVVSRHDSTATVSCLMAWEADCAPSSSTFCASSIMATSSGSQASQVSFSAQSASHAIRQETVAVLSCLLTTRGTSSHAHKYRSSSHMIRCLKVHSMFDPNGLMFDVIIHCLKMAFDV